MKMRFTRGYYLRGFSAIGIAVAVAVLTDAPGRSGDVRGLVYFVTFAIVLATFESIARRKGWPRKVAVAERAGRPGMPPAQGRKPR